MEKDMEQLSLITLQKLKIGRLKHKKPQ